MTELAILLLLKFRCPALYFGNALLAAVLYRELIVLTQKS